MPSPLWRRRLVGGGNIHDGMLADFMAGNFYTRVPGGALTRFATAQTLFSWSSSAKWVRNSAGIMALSSANQPAYEWGAAGDLLGALFEGTRTNRVLQSGDPANATWSKVRSSIGSGSATTPFGTTVSRVVEDTTASSTHGISQGGIAGTGSTVQTMSAWFKAAERTHAALFDAGGSGALAIFSLSGGGSVTTVSGATAAIEAWLDGWYRAQMTFTAAGGGANPFPLICNGPTGSTYTGDGTSGLFMAGFQLEAGTFASSYIPTTTASVTRNDDIVTRSLGSEFNQSEGTFFTRSIGYFAAPTTQAIVRVDDGTNTNYISHLNFSDSPRFQISRTVSVDIGASLDAVSAGTVMRFASRHKQADYARVANNGTVRTATTAGAMSPNMTTMRLGQSFFAANNPFFGHIQRIEYWPTGYTDAQLQGLVA